MSMGVIAMSHLNAALRLETVRQPQAQECIHFDGENIIATYLLQL
jgi:hypothetical protein